MSVACFLSIDTAERVAKELKSRPNVAGTAVGRRYEKGEYKGYQIRVYHTHETNRLFTDKEFERMSTEQ